MPPLILAHARCCTLCCCAMLQSRCAEVLESSATHYTIIALTLLDLGIVVTELILSSIFPAAEAVPHAGAAPAWRQSACNATAGALPARLTSSLRCMSCAVPQLLSLS